MYLSLFQHPKNLFKINPRINGKNGILKKVLFFPELSNKIPSWNLKGITTEYHDGTDFGILRNNRKTFISIARHSSPASIVFHTKLF